MRIMVIGSSGAGKTTLAQRLSARLGAPHVDLDALNWMPNWRSLYEDAPEVFARRVADATAGYAWISAGNYSQLWPLMMRRAEHIVWLDYPRAVVMRRVILRSFVRAAGGRELWPGTGNRETFARWFRADHPIRLAWRPVEQRRARYAGLIADLAAPGVKVHHLRRPREADALVRRLAASAQDDSAPSQI